MLNISDNSINHAIEQDMAGLQSCQQRILSRGHVSFRNLILTLLGVIVFFMFLPWTQNIQGNGKVTPLKPGMRPQTIQATISGRIERWYVGEGAFVKKGDTIVYISEVKSDYFDPNLVQRVSNQVEAKRSSVATYDGKINALENQISAMHRERENKLSQIRNKIEQGYAKVRSDSIYIKQTEVEMQIAERQFDGAKNMNDKGLIPLKSFEDARDKLASARTKLVDAQNKFEISRQELQNYRIELPATRNEYDNKISKAQSDRFSTMSDQLDAIGSANKLEIDRDNYARRQSFYYITAPQDGYVVKAIKPGIGEIIKESDDLVTLQPADYQLAVEMYVKPLDLPLIHVGNTVRFQFDGWPAFFFSGWPGVSFGTYAGKVVSVDRNISPNGKFRILVGQDPTTEPWPQAVQPGGGARGIALLNDVPVWYELWRVLNGFPSDQYAHEEEKDDKKEDSGGKPKAPIKSAK
jgi:membrane fusion protein, adhesin transport system